MLLKNPKSQEYVSSSPSGSTASAANTTGLFTNARISCAGSSFVNTGGRLTFLTSICTDVLTIVSFGVFSTSTVEFVLFEARMTRRGGSGNRSNALNVTINKPLSRAVALSNPGVQWNVPSAKVAPSGISSATNVKLSPSGSTASTVNETSSPSTPDRT